MAKILLTGGTGLVGTLLEKKLKEKNHDVYILTRSPKKGNHFKWDLDTNYIDEKAFDKLDYIIHLAGAGIADKRWTNQRKKELIDSRVSSANLLYNYIQKLNIPLQGFISSSGINFYGAVTTDKIYTENDAPGNDFISKICIEWEKSANQFSSLNIPVTILRTGVVLSKNGGALQKMNTPLFLSSLGSGKQFIPWIHIDDLCEMYCEAVEDSKFTGIYNAATNDHQTNKSFTQTLGKVLKKPVTPFNVPAFVLKIIVGELAIIVLQGSKASADKIEQQFTFKYNKLEEALKEIYN
ncbi:TIGR01777 family oxidoreductase [uncultured Tenacibaculum sp.]|uniref:TIGR01777 family oxidoreductase n=1 Tax=uncultured Tenacibaculum sp. TaxID=174713 RepID=UPI00260C6CA1|nr:TIGR01777 family oxidoreductase [uncultured Tenacibaculum sp.]